MNKDIQLGRLWDEWLSAENKSQAQNDFEVSGLLAGMKFSEHQNIFKTNRLRTARRLMRLWPMTSYYEKFNFSPQIALITEKNCKPQVKITCLGKILRLPNKKTLRGVWSFLKGLFGSAGGLYFPKNGYYLTLNISGEKISNSAVNFLNLTHLNWNVHRNEFMLRNHEDIMTFLCNISLPETALEFDKIVMLRSLRNKANVQSNYEAANIARSVNAARQQVQLAKKFLALNITLPDNLREIAELRIKFPDDTLQELGAKLNPPVTKSTVMYRFNKIKELGLLRSSVRD